MYYEHKGWNGCKEVGDHRIDSNRGKGRGNTQTDEQAVTFSGLHAFSLYELSMKALATSLATRSIVTPPEEARAIGETRRDVPNVAPERSPIEPR